MKTSFIIAGTVVALVAGASVKLMGNKQRVQENIYQFNPEKKVLVQADTAAFENLDRSFVYTGTFLPAKEVMIIPQVHGEVTGVYFQEGDHVKSGKRLLQVDDELLQVQYASAHANYEVAKRNLERYEKASQGGGVSQLQLDNYRLNFKTAESQWKQLAKQIRLSKIDAPFSGTITYKSVEVGSVVSNAVVARITDLSELKLEISVPETEITHFREGDFMDVVTDVYPGRTFRGRIEYVANRADDAHKYTVKILIVNHRDAFLKAGMYGTAKLSRKLKDKTIAIPRTALLGSVKNPQVFVIENNTATLRSIQTGASNSEAVEVTEGIKAGDIVVTGGQINLKNGSKVEVAR